MPNLITNIFDNFKDINKGIESNIFGLAKSINNLGLNPYTLPINILSTFFINSLADLAQVNKEKTKIGDFFQNDNNYNNLERLKSALKISFATGGEVKDNNEYVDINIENNEVVETPDGVIRKAEGKSHNQGGINIKLPVGSKIYSDRIKVDGQSMAERKLKRENLENKLEKLLAKNPSDIILRNTYNRIKEKNELEEYYDTQFQNMVRKTFLDGMNNFLNIYATGGILFNDDPPNQQNKQNFNVVDELINKLNEFEDKVNLKDFLTSLPVPSDQSNTNTNSNYYNFANNFRQNKYGENVRDIADELYNLKKTGNLNPNILKQKYPLLIKAYSQYQNRINQSNIQSQNTINSSNIQSQDNINSSNIQSQDNIVDNSSLTTNLDTKTLESTNNITNDNSNDLTTSSNQNNTSLNLPLISNNIGFNTIGDIFGKIGIGLNASLPFLTIFNRMTDKLNENPFKGFGQNALNEINKIPELAKNIVQQTIKDIDRYQAGLINKNRMHARTINVQRALDTVAHTQALKQREAAQSRLLDVIQRIANSKANLYNIIDQITARGEYMADLANRQDKDIFFSNLAKDLTSVASAAQSYAKIANKQYENNLFLSLLPTLTQYGLGFGVDNEGWYMYDSKGNKIRLNTPVNNKNSNMTNTTNNSNINNISK